MTLDEQQYLAMRCIALAEGRPVPWEDGHLRALEGLQHLGLVQQSHGAWRLTREGQEALFDRLLADTRRRAAVERQQQQSG